MIIFEVKNMCILEKLQMVENGEIEKERNIGRIGKHTLCCVFGVWNESWQ
jgi:hypothetical protein